MSKYKKMIELSFKSVQSDMNGVYYEITRLKRENATLREALAGLRIKAEDDNIALKESLAVLRNEMAHKFSQLATNGVATSINKINEELFSRIKQPESGALSYMFGHLGTKKATLAGKVDAIIEHLGIEVDVEVEKKATTKATKVKAPKKGRK